MKLGKLFSALLFVGFASAIVACQPATPPPPTVTATITKTATITRTPTKTPLPLNLLTASSCTDVKPMARIGKGQINKMFYTADGTQLLIASAGGIELYDANQTKLLWNGLTKEGITDAGIDEDDQTIIALDKQNTVYQFDLKTGNLINSAPQENHDKFMGVALKQDGKTVAAATFEGEIYQYDTTSFDKKDVVIKGPGTFADAMFGDMIYFNMHYSPDGKYLVFATLRTEIFVYDASSGKLVRKIAPLDPDYDKRIFPEEMTVSNNGKVMGIQYQNGQTMVVPTTGSQPGVMIKGSKPSLSPDGSTVALKTAKGEELFQTASGKLLNTLPDTEKTFGDSIFSPDGQTLGVVMPEETVFWDTKQLTAGKSVETAFTNYQAMALSQDGKTLAAGSPTRLESYQIKDGERHSFDLEHPAEFMKFAGNDSTLVIGGATWLSTFDMQQNKITKKIDLPGKIENMDVANDGKTAVVIIQDSVTMLYDLVSGQSQTIGQTSQNIVSAVFVGNGNILALDKDNAVLLSTRQNPAFAKNWTSASGLTPANGNPLIALPSSDIISVYDVSKRQMVQSPFKDELSIWAISPVNDLVAHPNDIAETLTLMDIHKSSSSCEVKNFHVEARRMIFSPDGQYLLINGQNGMIYMFSTMPQDNPTGY